jgi:nitrite reductase/ring-hydroxylating ferredoxin subunit
MAMASNESELGRRALLLMGAAFAAHTACGSADCCTLAYLSSSNSIFCPCTGTEYDLTGMLTSGPTGPSLSKLPACADSSAVYVTIG